MDSTKQAPPSLLENNEQNSINYRDLVEICNDLIWSVDISGCWTFLNRKATQQIYGYEPEEMLGKSFTLFEPPEQIEKDLLAFAKVKAGVPHFKYETVHIRKDGRRIHLSFNAIVLKDATGKPIGATGTATDISEQKETEKILKDKSNLLVRFQNSLLALSKMDFSNFKSSLQKIIEVSAQVLNVERVSFWSFNSERTEIICEDLFTQSDHKHTSGACLKANEYPQYFKAMEENLLLACEDARKDPRTHEFEKDYLIPQNIYSMMDIPVRFGGQMVGVLCHEQVDTKRKWKEEEQDFATSAANMISIALLISQLRNTESALQKKTAELQRSNKALEEFAYIASHDLQEPLYIITAFLDNIRQKHAATLDPQVTPLIERIYSAAIRMNQLIRDLLNYAKINIRKKPFEEVDLNAVVQDAWHDLELRVTETHAKLITEKLPILYSDKVQITQLFLNLLSNALKFKKENTAPQIKIFSKMLPNQMAEITIEDNGIGFEEEYVAKIFQPFQRLHPRKSFEGSGIGLAICKKIVERHHGKIEAQSQNQNGSKFIITLPLQQTEIS